MSAFVQETTGNNTGSTALGLPSITLAAGEDCLVLWISLASSSVFISSVTDNNGGTWTEVPRFPRSNGTTSLDCWISLGHPAGATVVTINKAGSVSINADLTTYSGVATASAADGWNYNNFTTQQHFTTGLVLPRSTTAILVGAAACSSTAQVASTVSDDGTGGGTATLLTTQGTNRSLSPAYQVLAAANTSFNYEFNFDFGTTRTGLAAIIVLLPIGANSYSNAVSFDSHNLANINIIDLGTLTTGTQPITILAYLKIIDFSANGVALAVGMGATTGANGFGIGIFTGPDWYFQDFGSGQFDSTILTVDDQWTLVAMEWPSTVNPTIYYSTGPGSVTSSHQISASGQNAATPHGWIGGVTSGTSWTGLIANVAIFSTSLTQSFLDQLAGYTAQSDFDTAILAQSGLQGYWKLNDAVGSSTAADSSSGGHTGTVTNVGGVVFGQLGPLTTLSAPAASGNPNLLVVNNVVDDGY